jgi:(2R)-ethylmalonyl-CoA mutase
MGGLFVAERDGIAAGLMLLEMLAVVLSKDARARAVQLPAWNEALGLPRPWDQQWSLRLQQIVAFETDLLEYGDIFDGSIEIARKVEELKAEATAEMARIAEIGGAVAAIEAAYMKQRLVESNLKRLAAIEAGEQTVVGVNAYTEAEPSPLSVGASSIMTVDASVEQGPNKFELFHGRVDPRYILSPIRAGLFNFPETFEGHGGVIVSFGI